MVSGWLTGFVGGILQEGVGVASDGVKGMREREERRIDLLLERVGRMAKKGVPREHDAEMHVELWVDSVEELRLLVSEVLQKREYGTEGAGADWWRVENAAECVEGRWSREGGLFRVQLASEPVWSGELSKSFVSLVQGRMRRLEGDVRDRAVEEFGVDRNWAGWAASVSTRLKGDAFCAQRARSSLMSSGKWNDEDTVRQAWSWTGCPVVFPVSAVVRGIPDMESLDGSVMLRREMAVADADALVFEGEDGREARRNILVEAGFVRSDGSGRVCGSMLAISRSGILRGLHEGSVKVVAAPTGVLEGLNAKHGQDAFGEVVASCEAGPAFEEDAVLAERHVRERFGMSFSVGEEEGVWRKR